MKTSLPSLKNMFTAAAFAGKLNLLTTAVLLCLSSVLYAGTKPVYTKNRHIKSPGLKADALMVNRPRMLALPTLVYNTSTPQTYTINTAVTLTPSSSGVSAPGYTTPTTFASMIDIGNTSTEHNTRISNGS